MDMPWSEWYIIDGSLVHESERLWLVILYSSGFPVIIDENDMACRIRSERGW